MPVSELHITQAAEALHAIQPGRAGDIRQPLETLRDAARLELATRAIVGDVVAEAREKGVSWKKIADALELSVANTFDRFKHLDPMSPVRDTPPPGVARAERRARDLGMGL